jgi:hypothetical protein
MKWRKEWGSHLYVLMKALSKTSGPILEVGSGLFSTPYLYYACLESKRPVYCLESNPEYYERNKQFESDWYHIKFVENWDKEDFKCPTGDRWSVVLMDQDPGSRRRKDAPKVLDAELILFHDSQSIREYGYNSIFPLFKFRRDFTEVLPWTTICSNVTDPKYL